MKMKVECVPCLLTQFLDCCTRSRCGEQEQRELLVQACGILAKEVAEGKRLSITMSRVLNKLPMEKTGVQDPYGQVKSDHIKGALELFPHLQELVNNSDNRLETALKLAAAGNVLDVAVDAGVQVDHRVEAILKDEFAVWHFDRFVEELAHCDEVLYLADNAGETVFDRLLMAELPVKRVYYAVKESPVINDAVAEDAEASGISEVATIISSGSSVAGTALDECSPQFREMFASAQMILSKGMGNYEALSECGRPVYYLLKAKCVPVARDLGVQVGDFVFGRGE